MRQDVFGGANVNIHWNDRRARIIGMWLCRLSTIKDYFDKKVDIP